jgi:sugar phosphate isomerase/epimerase
MAATMQGPGLSLGQFAGDAAPFNILDAIAGWAAWLGYGGVQIWSNDFRFFALDRAGAGRALR